VREVSCVCEGGNETRSVLIERRERKKVERRRETHESSLQLEW